MYYDSICNVLTDVSKMTIPTTRFKCSKDFIVPGFNEHLKELHCKARAQYLTWKKMLVDPELESYIVICEVASSVLNTHFVNAVRMKI